MRHVVVHIERVVTDGPGAGSLDAGALGAHLAEALETALGSYFSEASTGREQQPRPMALARLRVPDVTASARAASVGAGVGRGLATAIGPLCGPASDRLPSPRGTS
jgi:hypothetical protein